MEETDMKICANCGAQIPDDAAFCNNCGSSVVGTVEDNAATGATADNAGSANTNVAPAQGQGTPTIVPAPSAGQGSQSGNFQQQSFGQAPYQQPQYQPQYIAYDPSDHTQDFDPKDIEDNRLFAVLPYLFSLFTGILAGVYVKDSEYVKFHIKNVIKLNVAILISILFCVIPFIGWIIGCICLCVLAVVKIIGIVWVFQGKAKDLPIISSIGFLK